MDVHAINGSVILGIKTWNDYKNTAMNTTQWIVLLAYLLFLCKNFKRLRAFFHMRRMYKREFFTDEQVDSIMDKVDQKVEDTQNSGQDFYYKGKKVADKQDLDLAYKYAYRKMCENKGFKFTRFGEKMLEYDCTHTEKTCKRDTTLHDYTDSYSEETLADITDGICTDVTDSSGRPIKDSDGKVKVKCKDIKYAFKVGDKSYDGQIEKDLLEEGHLYNKGDKVKIEYNAENPKLNRLKSPLNAYKGRTENSLDHLEWRPDSKKCVLAYQPLIDFCNDNELTYDRDTGKCSVNKKYCECRGVEWRSGTVDCRYRPGQKEAATVFGKSLTQGITLPPYCMADSPYIASLGPAGVAYSLYRQSKKD